MGKFWAKSRFASWQFVETSQEIEELATHYWLQKVSGLGELIDYHFERINLYKMYKISDQLLKNKEAIETHMYLQEKNLLGFRETIALYDLTNTYFEGSSKANKLS